MNLLRWCVAAIALLLGSGLPYLLFWPVPIQPVSWQAPAAPGYVGVHAPNTGLVGLQHLDLGDDAGPEHVVLREEDGQQWVYTTVARGAVMRMKPDGSAREDVVRTGGRPLGFDFDAEGALIVADPLWGEHGGLLRVTGRGAAAKITLLTDRVDHPVAGDPIAFADAVVVARDGRIYFSDASRRFGAKAWGGPFHASVLDVMEQSRTGRVLVFDPATRRTEVLLDGLSFANGLALSADERHLFVTETGAYRVWKLAVQARQVQASEAASQPNADTKAEAIARVLLSNLPGFPDNAMRGRGGRIWIGLAKPRSAFADDNSARPWLRALALRLPEVLWPVPKPYGHVFAIDETGRVLADLQDASGAYPETTGVTESADRLYIHSLHAKTLAWRPPLP
jgi:sugar lactone lactonase YvrE